MSVRLVRHRHTASGGGGGGGTVGYPGGTGPQLTTYPFPATTEVRKSIVSAPLAPNSAAVVANIVAQATPASSGGLASYTPTLQIADYAISMVTVPTTQPKVTVQFNNQQNKTGSQPGWATTTDSITWTPDAALTNVPVPPAIVVPTGTDMAVAIYDATADKIWEYWQFQKGLTADQSSHHGTLDPTQWSAVWGGLMTSVSASADAAFPFPYGHSASGLASMAVDLMVAEAQAGVCNHAIALQGMYSMGWPYWSYPANRCDGGNPGGVDWPRHGQRYRLKSTFNVSGSALHPIAKVIAAAAQTYGLIYTDTMYGGIGIACENGAGIKAATGVDPWTTLCAGTPSYAVLNGFPWDQLEAIQVDWNKP
jgi:hypothetical protein